MLNKAIILIISVFILSSCVTGPEGYFKKSANNKLFDRKGFKGGKRPPLYNKKYIAKAKQNVATNNYEDDDELEDYEGLLENENISKANRDMYREMLQQDIESKYLGRGQGRQNANYPSLVRNSTRTDDSENTDNTELRAELEEIKSMLNETKNEMASYKCPTAKELERAQAKLDAKSNNDSSSISAQPKPKPKPKPIMPEESTAPSNSTVIQPINSI